MSTATIRALEKARRNLGNVSDYRVSITLGITRSCVSRWRNLKSQAEGDTAVQLARLAGMEPGQLLAAIEAERCKDSGAKAIWLQLAKLAQAACLGLAFLLGYTPNSQARSSVQNAPETPAIVGHIIKALIALMRRGFRLLGANMAGIFRTLSQYGTGLHRLEFA